MPMIAWKSRRKITWWSKIFTDWKIKSLILTTVFVSNNIFTGELSHHYVLIPWQGRR